MSPSRSRRRPFELLLVAGMLAAILWVWTLNRERSAPTAAEVAVLPPAAGEPVGGYLLIDGDTLHFDLRGDDYWLRSPRDRLDPTYVLELMRQAQTLNPIRVLPDTGGSGFGLSPARGGIGLELADGTRWAIEVGDEVPAGGQRYARLPGPGARVFLLDGYIAHNFYLPTLDRARDRVAASLRTGPPDSIAVLVPGLEVRARRETKDLWRATTPPGLTLDPARVNAVVQLLRGPNIRSFVSASPAADSLGLIRPRATWILCQGARRESVRVGHFTEGGGGVYILPAGRAGAAVLAPEQYRSLVGGWPELADRRLFTLAADSVESIRFLTPSSGGYLRADGVWRRERGEEPPRRASALSTELGNLLLLQWESWPKPGSGPRAGAPRIRLALANSAAAETLELAPEPPRGAWARSSHRRLWGRVPELVWAIWHDRSERP